ncbi:MAG: Response regulator, CheY-like [Verrucomicrobiales bacterium]|nr:Response regulator, CheY-like [Verrucomicrobiales bacterium]
MIASPVQEPVQRRVILVDDDLLLLGRYRKAFTAQNLPWHVEYADNAARALSKMHQSSFDAAVVDLLMPETDTHKLLQEIAAKYPSTLRIAVSDQEKRTALQLKAPAHQHLAKPFDFGLLHSSLQRAFEAGDLLPSGKLKQMLAGIQTLPTPPSVYTEVLRELQSPDPDMEKAGEIIGKDLALIAKLLQLVNSAFFGLPRTISSPVEAAMFLGTGTLKALVLSIQTFTQFAKPDLELINQENLWQHSWQTGVFAKSICETERADFELTQNTFIAALLHDIGKLLLAASFPDEYRAALNLAKAEALPEWEAELQLYQATHSEVGGYLLGLWGLAPSITSAVAYHHRPEIVSDRGLTPLLVVHAANLLAHNTAIEFAQLPDRTRNFFEGVGGESKYETWRQACLQASSRKSD